VIDAAIVPPKRNGRNLQPPIQPAVRVGEDAAKRASNYSSAMENRGRAPDSPGFGMILRHYRITAGLSQEALAERARMSTQGISALERGYRRTPQRETLSLLASALALNDEQRQEFEATAARSVLLGRGASVTVGPWADGRSTALPLALTSFVGRETELDEIATLVREHRMVTLTGTGGIGKTQTALQVATTLRGAANIAVCFIGLASVSDPSFVVTAIASALRVQEVPNRPLLETLLAYLDNKALLLILDNCEHVITEGATAAATLLIGCPRVRILATSREPLRAAGEYCYRLPSLSLPSPEASRQLSVSDATGYGAIVLFTDRACAANHRFTLTDENAPIVAELCRHLDGIPLAIELAAARVSHLSLNALVQKLDDRFGVLTGGERTALPRQQMMRATIDWSYDLLAAPEQRVFERLSVFAGGCTLAAAAAVCGDEETAEAEVFNLLLSLVDKSLVVADLEGVEPRYRLLESFRQYAREKLTRSSERDAVARRHAIAYLEHATRVSQRLSEHDNASLMVQLQDELDNYRSALRWALTDRGDVLLGQRLAGQQRLWKNSPVEGRRWITVALELVDERTPTSVLANLSLAQATVAQRLTEYEAQLASSETAIAHYRVAGDKLRLGSAQSLAGQALICLGRMTEAKRVLEEALQRARELGHRRLVAYLLRLRGLASAFGGDFVDARGYVAEALAILEAMDYGHEVAWALDDLGEYEFLAGNADLALQHATDALAAFRTFNDALGVAGALDCMAIYLIPLARFGEAEQCVREALDLARDRQWEVKVASGLQILGAIAALRPHVDAERTTKTHARVARLFGFADAHFAATGSRRIPLMAWQYSRVLSVLRESLGVESLAKLMAEGAAMNEEQAVQAALTI
jgi:predicted ATPase/transcriptional regulator with XRE-family HTH domain